MKIAIIFENKVIILIYIDIIFIVIVSGSLNFLSTAQQKPRQHRHKVSEIQHRIADSGLMNITKKAAQHHA